MKDPNKQLSEILTIYRDRVLQLDMTYHILKTLNEGWNDNRIDVLKIFLGFFRPIQVGLYSFIVLELNKLFDKREERTLLYFLTHVKTHFKAISIKDGQLTLAQVQSYLDSIDQAQPIISKLLIRRDKYYAHSDTKYFGKVTDLDRDAPVYFKEMDLLMDLAKEIVLKHYRAFFDKDLLMRVVDTDDVDRLVFTLQNYEEWINDPDIFELISLKESKKW